MKLKHNKKRNTAFLYEILVRQLTKSIIDKNNDEKKMRIKWIILKIWLKELTKNEIKQ